MGPGGEVREAAGRHRRAQGRRSATGGVPIDTLLRRHGKRGRAACSTTIDRDVQQAAEEALGNAKRNAALVAIQPSTGDVLAVANRPVDYALDRALKGRYPPGSTFKVVTTAALLRAG